jgi:hypothetical protein
MVTTFIFIGLYIHEKYKPDTTCPPCDNYENNKSDTTCPTAPACLPCDNYLGIKLNNNNENINIIINKTNELLDFSKYNMCIYIDKHGIKEQINNEIEKINDDEINDAKGKCSKVFAHIKNRLHIDVNRMREFSGFDTDVKTQFITNIIDLLTLVYPSICEDDKFNKAKAKKFVSDIIDAICIQ